MALGEAGNKAETPRRSLKERLMSSYSARSAPPTPEHKPASSSADMSLPLQVEFLLLLCVNFVLLVMCGFVLYFWQFVLLCKSLVVEKTIAASVFPN